MKIQQWFLCNNRRVCSSLRPSNPLSILTRHRVLSRYFQSSTVARRYNPLQELQDVNIDQFRKAYFAPERPTVLPRRYFRDLLPAFDRWFQPSTSTPNASQLNTRYLAQHGADALVPLELTQSSSEDAASLDTPPQLGFRQFHAPLSLFLEWISSAETPTQSQSTRLYLAQCQLLDLPQVLRDDFPTPEIVAQAGKGDVYNTNVWIGYPPTYTPLHRDPNPNLFVQLSGRKFVRLLSPEDGQRVFASMRRQLGRRGDREAAVFRGEEMMQGKERELLDQAVWSDALSADGLGECEGYEAHLEAGDGVFIPKGWWHSIKGVGDGVTGSVNWWFR